MKIKINIVDCLIAIFIIYFMTLCMFVILDAKAKPFEYNPPCSLSYQLTILEELRCKNHE